MNRVCMVCLLVFFGSMFLVSSARILQPDSMKVSKHHEYYPKPKPAAKSSVKRVRDSELPVRVTEDGYTIVTIPKTAEKHSFMDSLMDMFRNGTKVDHQALLVIAPAGGDITEETNTPKTESDVVVSVRDHAKTSTNETITVNKTLLNTNDGQKMAANMATWLSENVLLLNKGSDSKSDEFFIILNDYANGNIKPSDLQLFDKTGINYDLATINNNDFSNHRAVDTSNTSRHKTISNKSTSNHKIHKIDEFSDPKSSDGQTQRYNATDTSATLEQKETVTTATSDHTPSETGTPSTPNNTTHSGIEVSDTETNSGLKDTDSKSHSEVTVSENTTTPSVPNNYEAVSTSDLKDSNVDNASDPEIIYKTTSSSSDDDGNTTPFRPKNSGTEPNPDLNIVNNTTTTTISELKTIDITTPPNFEVSTNTETTKVPKKIDLSTTSSDLPSTDLKHTQENRELVDPSTTHDIETSETIISPSAVRAPTSTSTSTTTTTKQTDGEAVAKALPLGSFDNLVNDLSIISNAIDVPINLDATNKILNEREPLIDVCRESQKELIDIFNLGLGQLSSLFTAMYKRISSFSTQTTQ